MRCILQILMDCLAKIVQVLSRITVFNLGIVQVWMKQKVRRIILQILFKRNVFKFYFNINLKHITVHSTIVRQLYIKRLINSDRGLIGPASGHISHCITSTSKNDSWQTFILYKLHTFTFKPKINWSIKLKQTLLKDKVYIPMTLYGQVKTTKSITAQTISTTLQNNSSWPVELNDILHDSLEYIRIIWVSDALLQWHIDRVVSTVVSANLEHVTCAREKAVSVLVKWNSHHSIRQIECILHTIAVVNINIDIKHTRMYSKTKPNKIEPNYPPIFE